MIFVHPTAEVDSTAEIGDGSSVWHYSQIRKNAKLGTNCTVGKNVDIDNGVIVGNNVKIQNNSSLFHGLSVEDGVFIGPHVIFTNDKYPRAITPQGEKKTSSDWQVVKTHICYGASIGAGSTVLGGVKIGKFAMIAAGSTVNRDVPDYSLVVGAPSRIVGFVCKCGTRLQQDACVECGMRLADVQINISKPGIGDEEVSSVINVLRSGNLAQGSMVKEFENNFSAYLGVSDAVCVQNGTVALYLSLLALGIKAGDEVITTPFSFFASASSILMTGASPVFIDVNYDDFCIDPNLIEEKITDKTRAILVVHLYGQSCDMAKILELARKYNLKVIEDACQAHGAEFQGQKVGGIGDVGCFSFYSTKNITMGEGGAITTNNKDLAEKVRLLRNHGMKIRYYHDTLGFNYRMTDIAAAIGVEQLKKLDTYNDIRRKNAHYLSEKLSGIKGLIIPTEMPGRKHVYHQYTVRITNEYKLSRENIIVELANRGISTGIYYPRLISDQSVFRELGYISNFTKASNLCNEVLSLPVHPFLSKQNLEYMVEVITKL